jgi:hypothetical protein
LWGPQGSDSFASDASGNIYIADANGDHAIARVDAQTGQMTLIAGLTGTFNVNATYPGTCINASSDKTPALSSSDYLGSGCMLTAISIGTPSAIALNSNGDLFYTDTTYNAVRKLAIGNTFGSSASPISTTTTQYLRIHFYGSNPPYTTPGQTTQGTGAFTISGSSAFTVSSFLCNKNAYDSTYSTECYVGVTYNPAGGNAVAVLTAAGTTQSSTVQLSGYSNSSTSATATVLTTSTTSATPGVPLTLTATVTTTGSNAPTGTVTFSSTSTTAGAGSLGTATVNGSGVASITVPVWQGADTVTALYSGDTNNSPSTSNTVNITNLPSNGTLVMNWPSISFPTAYGAGSGAKSGYWPVTLTNYSPNAVSGISVSFTGAGASNFNLYGNNCTGSLAAGASCYFSVYFSPLSGSAVGTSTATLTATNGTLTATVPVSGLVSALLASNYPYLNWGNPVAVGATTSSWSATLTNISGGSIIFPASGSDATISVTSPATITGDFTIASDSCAGATKTAAQTCAIGIEFTPKSGDVATTGTTTISGTLTVTTSSPVGTFTLPLSGVAKSGITINWPLINFAPVAQGATGTAWPVKITNNTNLVITPTATLGSTTNFSITSPCTTIAANGSCTFNVVPNPAAATPAGAISTTLTVTGVDTNSVNYTAGTINVTGTVTAAGYSINWNQDQQAGVSTIDFGVNAAAPSTPYGPWPITVLNNTGAAQTLTLTPTSNISGADFSVSAGTCATPVAAGGTCTFNLSFNAPTAASLYRDTLTISDTSSAYSYTFNIWGQTY